MEEGGDNVTHPHNESVGSALTVPEGYEFRFIYEGVLLTCVSMFGIVSNVIAVVVLLRYASVFQQYLKSAESSVPTMHRQILQTTIQLHIPTIAYNRAYRVKLNIPKKVLRVTHT